MDNLVRVVDLLKAARKLAEDDKAAEILIYLIGMAILEADYQVKPNKKASL